MRFTTKRQMNDFAQGQIAIGGSFTTVFVVGGMVLAPVPDGCGPMFVRQIFEDGTITLHPVAKGFSRRFTDPGEA